MEIQNNILIKIDSDDIRHGTVTIPESVKSIGPRAFAGAPIVSITIPDSVTSIGDSAFKHCRKLLTVNTTNKLKTINAYAFYGCDKLKEINIPDSVINIGDNAFAACNRLESVIIGKGIKILPVSVFDNCWGLKNITIPNSVKYIKPYAFAQCKNLTSVILSNKLEIIGIAAFSDCKQLCDITIPDSVTGIGERAFVSTGLRSVKIGKNVSYIGYMAFGDTELKSPIGEFKAFHIINKQLYCRGTKYFITKENFVDGDGPLKICEHGIHYCTNLFEIFDYYHGEIDSQIAIYKIKTGEEKVKDPDSSKWCARSIKLVDRLCQKDIIKLLNGGK